MSLHRRNAKRDLVEAEIKAALVKCGFSVHSVSSAGHPDLTVWREDKGLLLVECKSRGGRLTKAQKDFMLEFAGCPNIIIGVSAEQVLREVGVTS